MEDKQIFAYSWQQALKKKIQEFIQDKRKQKTRVVNDLPKPAVVQNKLIKTDLKTVKDIKANLKADNKQLKPESPKKNNKDTLESPLLIKERREKYLTYVIGGLILVVISAGILLENGIIKFSSRNANMKRVPLISPVVTINPVMEATSSVSATVSPHITTAENLTVTPTTSKCKISGCNAEICADESLGDIASICLYNERFSCYKNAKCERQNDGECAWTEDNEFKSCIEAYQ
jgi:hypothetical protein